MDSPCATVCVAEPEPCFVSVAVPLTAAELEELLEEETLEEEMLEEEFADEELAGVTTVEDPGSGRVAPA